MAQQAAALYAIVSIAGADKSVRDLQRVGGQITRTQGVMRGLANNAGQIAGGVGTVARGMVRVGERAGLAIVAAGVGATKVAVDFQDAYIGIQKTVEGTPAELNALNNSLKTLSTRIPVKYTDLASLAQEAGALGVATKDVVAFTEAVARTVAATVGLDNAVASEAFGKLGTIFSLTGKDYERLGSALVKVGNDGASTEAEIIAVTRRFSAVGQAAGLSAAQVIGWSSAISSLGALSEAAGSALSRIFQRVSRDIGVQDVGGKIGENATARLKTFAKVSGVTIKEFTDLYSKDASGAIEMFLGKLGELDKYKAGKALFEAGISNVRDINAVLQLAQHTDVLAKQLGLANDAWEQNTELLTISQRRFSGVKSTLTELWNTVLLGADAFGNGLLPAIEKVATKAKSFTLGHLDDLRTLGKDVGRSIDSIDWAKVGDGAQKVVDVAQRILDVVKKIPIEVNLGIAAFLGINKVSGGLLGQGAGEIAKGVLGVAGTLGGAIVRSIGKSIGGLTGGILGVAGATPVYVVNFPPGFGLGGGLGGAGGVAGGAAGSAATIGAGTVAALVIAPVALYEITKAIAGGTEKILAQDYKSRQATAAARGLNPANVPERRDPNRTAAPYSGQSAEGLDELVRIRALEAQTQARFFSNMSAYQRDENQRSERLRLTVDDLAKYARLNILRMDREDSHAKRGTKLTGEAAVLAGFLTRIGFIKTGKSANTVSTANVLAQRFANPYDTGGTQATRPFLTSQKAAERTLQAMLRDQRRANAEGDKPTARALGQSIATMRRVLAGDLGDLQKTAKETARETAKVKKETRDAAAETAKVNQTLKEQDLTVQVHPSRVSVNLNGRAIASAMVNWYDIHQRVG